ncbi:PREDICTED: uncharacterized protein LOC108448992 [Corvus brachyrhynchos]|uniref:uncharacterized protein LOC108448992 n=1 Tax=Corvus brachyrhynchos TaxID=85066 RepID=UPI00081669FF|nr:PREDICTED: uncharacterized protein LOC108448992 [Corvus brachyrhynchos]
MLAPVNGRDWQFITADSHTVERGPGGGTSPRGTPLEEPIPSSLPKHPPTGKEIRVCRASKGKNQTNPKPNSASVVRSVRGRDRHNLLSQPPTGHGLGSFRRGRVPRTAPGQLQAGQRGSATRGDTAVAPGDLVRLCLEENSPASPAARDKSVQHKSDFHSRLRVEGARNHVLSPVQELWEKGAVRNPGNSPDLLTRALGLLLPGAAFTHLL